MMLSRCALNAMSIFRIFFIMAIAYNKGIKFKGRDGKMQVKSGVWD